MHHPVSTTERDDQRFQTAVLEFVLGQPVGLLTTRDLLLELKDPDSVERAVRDLSAAGLLRQEGESVLPTLAAVRFDRLGMTVAERIGANLTEHRERAGVS